MYEIQNSSGYRTYYSTACSICLSTENVKRCSNCKVMPYCGQDHQRIDWKTHKTFCKVIVQSLSKIKLKITNYNDWRDYRYSLKLAWESALNRKLQPFEDFVWMFLRSCSICYKTSDLLECPDCLMVSYCKKHVQESHTSCNELKLCHAIDRYLIERNLLPSFFLKAIDDNVKVLPDKLVDFLELVHADLGMDLVIETLKIYSVDLVGTIIYAMEVTEIANERSSKNELTMHVIGASNETDKDWGNIVEILFHWLHNLRSITINFVGPELKKNDLDAEDYEKTFCSNCNRKSRHFYMNYYKVYYHECFHYLKKPDVIFAFNSGLSEYEGTKKDTWKDSLKLLLNYVDVPVVITAYTLQEVVKDLSRLQAIDGVECMLQPRKNLYCSTRPFRDWSTEGSPVYFNDNYISIVVKR